MPLKNQPKNKINQTPVATCFFGSHTSTKQLKFSCSVLSYHQTGKSPSQKVRKSTQHTHKRSAEKHTLLHKQKHPPSLPHPLNSGETLPLIINWWHMIPHKTRTVHPLPTRMKSRDKCQPLAERTWRTFRSVGVGISSPSYSDSWQQQKKQQQPKKKEKTAMSTFSPVSLWSSNGTSLCVWME